MLLNRGRWKSSCCRWKTNKSKRTHYKFGHNQGRFIINASGRTGWIDGLTNVITGHLLLQWTNRMANSPVAFETTQPEKLQSFEPRCGGCCSMWLRRHMRRQINDTGYTQSVTNRGCGWVKFWEFGKFSCETKSIDIWPNKQYQAFALNVLVL